MMTGHTPFQPEITKEMAAYKQEKGKEK